MCGIIGITGVDNVVEELYRGLIALQHRGQDSAGIITFSNRFHVERASGLVQAIFSQEALKRLDGKAGIAHVRYATIGEDCPEETQPFKKTYPFAVSMCHNGNVTNYAALGKEIYLDTTCDLEEILDIFIKGVQRQYGTDAMLKDISKDSIFEAAGYVMDHVEGSYSVVSYVPKAGLVVFRDQHGIKPLVYGKKGDAYCFASETIALDALNYNYLGSVKPGEAVIVDNSGSLVRKQVRSPKAFSPCIFELIYFARPGSMIEDISVSGFRYRLGRALAESTEKTSLQDIDIVTDVPSTSTRSAIAFAEQTGIKYRPIFDKNNYIGRSFIESSQFKRKHAVSLKFGIDLGLLKHLTGDLRRGVRIVKIDDSFVRGISNKTLNENLRSTGMIERIVDGSLSPRIEWPCVYGIDMSIRREFIAQGRTDEEIAKELGADKVIYMPRESLRKIANKCGLESYCEACFSGCYPTCVTEEDIRLIEKERIKDKRKESR